MKRGLETIQHVFSREDNLTSLSNLGMTLNLVQTEQQGTKHYKDDRGNRLTLYPDGSYWIEVEK